MSEAINEYDEGRVWFKKKGTVVTVGLTEKAMDEIGGIQSMSLPAEGDECSQDDVVGDIEGEKAAFEIISPMDGVIESVNESLAQEYEVLEEDPLDEGWIYKIRITVDEEADEDEDEEEESE